MNLLTDPITDYLQLIYRIDLLKLNRLMCYYETFNIPRSIKYLLLSESLKTLSFPLFVDSILC